MSISKKISFIGVGKMGEALVRGILSAGEASAEDITAFDLRPDRLNYIAQEFGISKASHNREAVRRGDVIILAVTPQAMKRVLEDIKDVVEPSQLLISIAAGITTDFIEDEIAKEVPVIRVMPNICCLIGEAAIALCRGKYADEEDEKLATTILSTSGKVVLVEERLMDAVTGLSGSGPAYVAVFIEALADAGVRVGLPRDTARTLALQTVLGTARMLEETKEHPMILKDKVASPGGTTIAGLEAIERGGLRTAIFDAVTAATYRSKELGK